MYRLEVVTNLVNCLKEKYTYGDDSWVCNFYLTYVNDYITTEQMYYNEGIYDALDEKSQGKMNKEYNDYAIHIFEDLIGGLYVVFHYVDGKTYHEISEDIAKLFQ